MREALAAADHDFVLSEPASKLNRYREKLLTLRTRGLSRAARLGRRYLSRCATFFFVVAIAAILLNALAWQRTRHPAPLFSRASPAAPTKEPRIAEMATVPAPRRPSALAPARAHDKPFEKLPAQKPLSEKPPLETPGGVLPRQTHANVPPGRPHDKISQLLKTPPASRPRPAPAASDRAAPSKMVLAAQRALVKLGFILNPDGVAGGTTRRAIERYERDHGLPVRGILTPVLMRKLNIEAGMTGER